MGDKDKIIEALRKENGELKEKLKKFEKLSRHWERMKQGLRSSSEIKDIDKILELRAKGLSMEKIAAELTAMGDGHKATRQTIINRLKKYEDNQLIDF